MQIQNYYYWADTARRPEPVGNPPPEWLDAAEKWLGFLSFEPERVSFFDLPYSETERLILLVPPGECESAVCFALPAETYRGEQSCYALYAALLNLAAPSAGSPLTLEIPQCRVEPTPIEAVFSELQGRQMVGDIDKSLLTVSRMLPLNNPETWFRNYFLAVNPNAYADDYTTVVCSETPDGEWRKLKSEHTEFSSAQTFRARKRQLMRRRMRSRFLMFFTLVALAGCVMLFALIAALYFNRKLDGANRDLRNRLKIYEFNRQRDNERILVLEQLRDTQAKQIQLLEAKTPEK